MLISYFNKSSMWSTFDDHCKSRQMVDHEGCYGLVEFCIILLALVELDD